MSAARVFLSYSPEDQVVAGAICEKIEERGIACWIASRDLPATDAQYGEGLIAGENVVAAIEASEVMVLVFSASSNISPRVRREIERAVARNMVIVPFRLEDVPLSKSMEYFISTTHWLNALTPPMETHLEYLAQTIEVLIADVESARHSSLVVQRRAGGPLPGMEKVDTVESPVSPALPIQTEWNVDEIRQVETALAAYIGPLAKMLVKQEQKTASSIGELYQSVVRHISHPAEKVKFLQRCESALKMDEAKTEVPAPSAKAQSLFAKVAGNRKTEEIAAPTLVSSADSLSNTETIALVEQHLAESIGPLAKVLVKRAVKEARDVSDLYQRLAQHVPAGTERARFLKHSEKKRA